MKSFNKILSVLGIALMLFFSQNVTAQERGHHGKQPSAEQVLAKMTEHLELTDAQQKQIAEILKEGEQNRKTIMQGNGEREDKRAAMKKTMEQQKLAIENVLTDEQKAKAKELKQEQRAQMKENRAKHKEQRNALKTALSTYKQQNITPVMKTQRVKLEKKLSHSDKKEIAAIRAKLAENKAAMKAKKEAFKKEGKNREDITEADKAAFKQLGEERKAEMEKARTIVAKYDNEIKSLFEEIKPQAEQWKTDIKAIHDQYKPEDGEHPKGMRKGHRGMPHHEGRMPHDNQSKKMDRNERVQKSKEMKAVHFLLLDPNAPDVIIEDSKNLSSSSLSVFPNPAQTFNNVEFKITKAGEISLELHDQDGNLVKTIINEYREAGSYQERVNLGELLNGFVYVYVLKTASGEVLSEKVVIRK